MQDIILMAFYDTSLPMTKKESIQDIHALRADYYPLLGQLMNEIGLAEIINEMAESEGSRQK